MKKLLALLLVAVMCLSLVACGGGETPSIDNNSTQEQQTQNDNNEPEGIEPDISEPENTEPEITEPENTEPQYETVEITLDNWQEYFEIREVHEYLTDAFGDFACIRSWYSIVSKDEFVPDPYASSVAIEYTYYVDVCPYTIDLDSPDIAFGDATKKIHYDTPRVESFRGVGQYIGETRDTRFGVYIRNWDRTNLQGDSAERIVEIDVTRISGTFIFTRRDT